MNNFSDTKVHVDSDYIAQIVKHDVNKGHIVDYRKISYKKIDIFFTKKFIKKFSMFSRIFFLEKMKAEDPLLLLIYFN